MYPHLFVYVRGTYGTFQLLQQSITDNILCAAIHGLARNMLTFRMNPSNNECLWWYLHWINVPQPAFFCLWLFAWCVLYLYCLGTRSALLVKLSNPRRRLQMRQLVVAVVPFGGSNMVSWNYCPAWCSCSCCLPKPYHLPRLLLPPPSHHRCQSPYRPPIYPAREVGVEAVAVLRTRRYRRPRRDGEHPPCIKPPQ